MLRVLDGVASWLRRHHLFHLGVDIRRVQLPESASGMRAKSNQHPAQHISSPRGENVSPGSRSNGVGDYGWSTLVPDAVSGITGQFTQRSWSSQLSRSSFFGVKISFPNSVRTASR